MPNLKVTRPEISGLILAGGRASRMGGQDKGLIPFAGRPLVEHLLEALTPQTTERLISANRNLERYRRYGVPVVSDRCPDFAGPLAGIAAGLHRARHELLLVVPCDGPRLPTELAQRLWLALRETGAMVAVANDGTRMQPTYALVRRTALGGIEERLAQGEYRLQSWVASVPSCQVMFTGEEEAFLNINTPGELADLETGWRSSGEHP